MFSNISVNDLSFIDNLLYSQIAKQKNGTYYKVQY